MHLTQVEIIGTSLEGDKEVKLLKNSWFLYTRITHRYGLSVCKMLMLCNPILCLRDNKPFHGRALSLLFLCNGPG